MGFGLGELVLIGVALLSLGNGIAAPIVGIVRAVGRRQRGARSFGAVVWSSINLALFSLAAAWALANHAPPFAALLFIPLNGVWLFLALQANRAAARKDSSDAAP